MKNKSLFAIIFMDGTNYIGGNSYFDTKWIDIPDKKIKRLFYTLPNGDKLCLEGYNKYFHMVEATRDLNGKKRGQIRVEYAYIMGEKENKIEGYKISLTNNEIEKFKYNWNDNFIQKLNPDGWK